MGWNSGIATQSTGVPAIEQPPQYAWRTFRLDFCHCGLFDHGGGRRRGRDVEPARPDEARQKSLASRFVRLGLLDRVGDLVEMFVPGAGDGDEAVAVLGSDVREMKRPFLRLERIVDEGENGTVQDRGLDQRGRVDTDHRARMEERVEVVRLLPLARGSLARARPDDRLAALVHVEDVPADDVLRMRAEDDRRILQTRMLGTRRSHSRTNGVSSPAMKYDDPR